MQPNAVTQTPAFKAWFKKSKVVDKNGNPLVVYHGTTKAGFDIFQSNAGIHFGTVDQANEIIQNKADKREGFRKHNSNWDNDMEKHWKTSTIGNADSIYPVYLSIQNPLYTDDVGGPNQWVEQIEIAREQGHDGIIYYNTEEGFDSYIKRGGKPTDLHFNNNSYVVFSSNQIKSAIGNKGTYNPENPNIVESFDQINPYKVALYEIILKNKPQTSVGIKQLIQAQIQNSKTLEDLERVAGQYNVWSNFKQYIKLANEL